MGNLVKKNRLARGSFSTEHYQKVADLSWNEEELPQSKSIHLKGMPRNFAVKMFRVPISTNRTDYVITYDPSQHCSDNTRKVCAIRWYIE